MVEIINSLEDLCRLCAGKIDVLMGLDIFASDHRQIFKKICVCLPIQISVDDSFPKMVCVECACKLDLMFDFRERSILTAHLFSDMMTVNSGNGVIAVNQNIPITDVSEEPDFNKDFLPCKLGAIKYNNELNEEISTGADENITNEDNFKMTEPTDEILKSKAEPELTVTKEKSVNLECEIPDPSKHQNNFNDSETLAHSKVFEMQENQNLHCDAAEKNISGEKFEVDSLLNGSSQNLNECPELEWFFCNMCNKTFEDKKMFESHNEEHVPVEKLMQETEKELPEIELPQNLPNKKKKGRQKKVGRMKGGGKRSESKVCMECGKHYQTNYKLQEHMRKHTGEKPFLCSYEDCRKAFRSKIGLAQHEANHSGQYEFSCNTCGKGFQCKSYLVVHQRVHSDIKPFVCKQCSRKFKTKQSLMDHMNRHLGVKPFLCDICGKGFITKGLCKSHQRVHSGTDNRQYPCHVCRKLFVSKSYLNTHFRIHTGEKPFMCEVCGKGFLTRVDLRIHSTMHTGEKSFVCEMCGKAFARRDALRCHRRSHTGERPYKCEFCGQSFTQFTPMAIHKRLHTGERPYECDACSKTFVSRSTMIAHKKKHHATNNEESRYQFVAIEVRSEELQGQEQQPSEQLVVIEDSPQLLLALGKRQEPSDIISLHKLKNESSGGSAG